MQENASRDMTGRISCMPEGSDGKSETIKAIMKHQGKSFILLNRYM